MQAMSNLFINKIDKLNKRKSFYNVNTREEAEEFISKNGFYINAMGENPLHIACMNGKIEIVKYILDKKFPNVHNRDNNGDIPIFFAVSRGHLEIVELILEENVPGLHLPNNFGQTPLSVAHSNKFTTICKVLKRSKK